MLTLPHTFHRLPAVEASSSGAAVVTEPRRRESALRRRFASVSSVVPRRRESALRRRFGSAVVSVPRRRESALRRRLASTVVLTLSSVVLTSSVSLLAIVIASQNGARLRMIIRVMNPMVCDLEEGGCGEHGVESSKTLSQCCPFTYPTSYGTGWFAVKSCSKSLLKGCDQWPSSVRRSATLGVIRLKRWPPIPGCRRRGALSGGPKTRSLFLRRSQAFLLAGSS